MVVQGLTEKVKVHAWEILGVRWTRPRMAVVGACLLVVLVILGFLGAGMWEARRAERLAAELRGRGVVLMPGIPDSPWAIVRQVLSGPMSGAINTANLNDQSGALRTPQDVERLLVFPELKYVHLEKCPLSDELVEVFSRMPHLEGIGLNQSRAGDRELESLTRLSKLQAVQLLKTEISDEGVKVLVRLPELHSLMLESRKIHGEGFADLSRLSKLTTLWIRGEAFDDRGLEKLVQEFEGYSRLQFLGLHGTRVTDEGLSCLARLKGITQLELVEMSISDAGLRRLKEMKSLRSIHLEKCKTSAAGVKAFETAVPSVNVTGETGAGAY